MKKYRLLINGKNFLIQTDLTLEKYGFFQTIFLESENSESAENKAVEIIRNSDLKELTINEENDPPMIYLEEIEEVQSFEGIESLNVGRSFYSEKEEASN